MSDILQRILATKAQEVAAARAKSALMHTLAAGDAAAAAVRLAGGRIAGACRKII
jgi:hypothetical protein